MFAIILKQQIVKLKMNIQKLFPVQLHKYACILFFFFPTATMFLFKSDVKV